jgi:hypothetical protein
MMFVSFSYAQAWLKDSGLGLGSGARDIDKFYDLK